MNVSSTSSLGRDRDTGAYAVILAGGVGVRLRLDVPKQLIPVAGKSSLEHTVGIFEKARGIDHIIVMMEPDYLDEARNLLPPGTYTKLRTILPGGSTRNETSRLALAEIPGSEAKVLFHDAVRPLLDERIIQDCLDALDSHGAVDTAIPSADTIIEVDELHHIVAVPKRASLRRGQTPQGFRQGIIARAYELASADPGFEATDDCSVVLKYLPEVPILVVDGSESNIKITHPVDVHIADKLFQLREHQQPSSVGAQVDLEGKSVVIFGASAGIGEDLAVQMRGLGATVHAFSRGLSGTDVRDRSDVRGALDQALTHSGRIDHVVLTAGVLDVGPLVGTTDEQLHRALFTNLAAAYVVAQESYSALAASHGSLLLYTSSSYTRGRANYSVYSSTKAAIVNLTQALADEWSSAGVRVNCISPARTATPMRINAFGSEDESTLLSSAHVAWASAQVLASSMSGQIFDIRQPKKDPAPTLHGISP